MLPPRVARVYETVVYGPDVEDLISFYGDVLGLRRVDNIGDLGAAFRLADGGMLLVFDPGRVSVPSRRVPSHGATGPGHVAFAIEGGQRERWLAFLGEHGVEVESEITWNQGGSSLYFRDPAGNSVELVDGEAWRP